MKHPVCGSLHGTILQSMCFSVHHVLHLSVAVTLVEGSKYFGFSFGVADTCPKTYIFVVEVEPGFVALQSVAVQHHAAGSVKAVADTSGKAVSIIAAFTPIGDGQGGIVLFGGDTGILAVIEYLEEISVVFSSGDENMISMDNSLFNLYKQGIITEETALIYSINKALMQKKIEKI